MPCCEVEKISGYEFRNVSECKFGNDSKGASDGQIGNERLFASEIIDGHEDAQRERNKRR